MPSKLKDDLFLLMIFYEGPWERAMGVLYGLRKDGTLRWEIPAHPKGLWWLVERAAIFCEKRDHEWRAKYVLAGKKPHERWSRRAA